MIMQVEYFISPALFVMPSVFMTGTYMALGSFSRYTFNDCAFLLLMKHMWALLSNSATIVSFFKGCTFQMSVMGILISFTPCALNCGALTFCFSQFLGISHV